MQLSRNAVTKALGTICTPPHTFIASDSLNLPKIHSEGVPIYDSIHGVSNEITTRKLLSKISPAIVIFLTSEPFISLFYYGSVAAVIYVSSYLIRLLDFESQRTSFWSLSCCLTLKRSFTKKSTSLEAFPLKRLKFQIWSFTASARQSKPTAASPAHWEAT